jgi:cobalt-zinc-cadmium efflux system outer membrane protein
MSKYFLKILNIVLFALLFTVLLNANSYGQNSFNVLLGSDSLYRYNTAPAILDSLIMKDYTKLNLQDTAFDNSFGKAEVIDLDRMVYFALNNNPELKSMRYSIESDKLMAEEKDYLPDPMFEFMLDNIMTDFKKVGMINFYVSQMFPFPGKLELQRKSVLDNTVMMDYDLKNMAANLINKVKMNYYDLFFTEQKLQINYENQLIMQNFITAAESKYSVGKGMQQEVFKSQIEFSKLQNEEYLLKQQKKNTLSELTRLTRTVINENTKVSYKNIDIEYLLDMNHFKLETYDTDKLVKYAFENRADIKALESKVLVNKTDLEIAKLEKMPDFNLKLGYKILNYDPNNAFTVMLGVSIPFAPWTSGKYDYTVKKSEVKIQASAEDIEIKKNEIRNEVVNSVNSLLSAKQTVNYYYTVMIPQTENSLKATQYNYENNMTSFLDLLDSYRMYQEAKLMFYESVTMYLKMIADVENATGMNFKNLK